MKLQATMHPNNMNATNTKQAGSLPDNGRTIRLGIIAILILGTFILFSRTIGGEILIWDDEINLWFTPQILQINIQSLAWMFADTEHVLRYKPLCWLTWAGIIQLFGETGPFRLPNVLAHAANAVMFFMILVKVIQPRNRSVGTRIYFIAGSLAAFWAWSPSRIEPATWISGLGYPLAAGFSLLSVILFERALSIPHTQTKRRIFILSIVAWTLALMSYPSALCALPLFPILAIQTDERRSLQLALQRSSIHLALGGVLMIFTFLTRILLNGVWTESALGHVSFSEQLARVVYFPMWTIQQMSPFASISPIHDQMTTVSLLHPLVLMSAMLHILVGILIIRHGSRKQLILWGGFLFALIPHTGLTESRFLPADRYTYTATLYLILLLGTFLGDLSAPKQRGVPIAVGICAVLAFTLSWSQTLIWRTNKDFLNYTYAQLHTDLYRADILLRLGRLEFANGNLDAANQLFRDSSVLSARDPAITAYLDRVSSVPSRSSEASPNHSGPIGGN